MKRPEAEKVHPDVAKLETRSLYEQLKERQDEDKAAEEERRRDLFAPPKGLDEEDLGKGPRRGAGAARCGNDPDRAPSLAPAGASAHYQQLEEQEKVRQERIREQEEADRKAFGAEQGTLCWRCARRGAATSAQAAARPQEERMHWLTLRPARAFAAQRPHARGARKPKRRSRAAASRCPSGPTSPCTSPCSSPCRGRASASGPRRRRARSRGRQGSEGMRNRRNDSAPGALTGRAMAHRVRCGAMKRGARSLARAGTVRGRPRRTTTTLLLLLQAASPALPPTAMAAMGKSSGCRGGPWRKATARRALPFAFNLNARVTGAIPVRRGNGARVARTRRPNPSTEAARRRARAPDRQEDRVSVLLHYFSSGRERAGKGGKGRERASPRTLLRSQWLPRFVSGRTPHSRRNGCRSPATRGLNALTRRKRHRTRSRTWTTSSSASVASSAPARCVVCSVPAEGAAGRGSLTALGARAVDPGDGAGQGAQPPRLLRARDQQRVPGRLLQGHVPLLLLHAGGRAARGAIRSPPDRAAHCSRPVRAPPRSTSSIAASASSSRSCGAARAPVGGDSRDCAWARA